ncbi:MAG: hypothetical protein J5565_06275 [Muribaculaceae bacterium]|nr:hypothetical protein [Muribaculaceae bacterium]
MPGWSDIFEQVNTHTQPLAKLTELRHNYLECISTITGRNVITYYSGWLKHPGAPNVDINDNDKNAFMNAIHQLDRTKGLDLILHTPGGEIAATESIVAYLKKMFNNDIRAIVPQISMSAGTMIAMSCKEIIMGHQSSLGPIDPQLNGVACQTVIDEFRRAVSEVKSNPASLGLWQKIYGKLNPTFLTACEDTLTWSETLATKWIQEVNPNIDINVIKSTFLDHKNSYSHARHISKEDCRQAGLNIVDLEANQNLQDSVLSLHHCYMILIDMLDVSKIVENQEGKCYLQRALLAKQPT